MISASALSAQDKILIIDEMSAIINDKINQQSSRHRDLLTYLVTNELEGNGENIRPFPIATEVLNRTANFDPQVDSIVRVEMGRLRRLLERYYLMSNRKSSFTITIPRGQYRPVFIRNVPDQSDEASNAGNHVEANSSPDFQQDSEPDASDLHETQTDEPAPSSSSNPPPPAERRGLSHQLAAAAFVITALFAIILTTYLIPAASLTPTTTKVATPVRHTPSIAVLPVTFSTDNPSLSYIGVGLQADITGVLSEFDWLTTFQTNPESHSEQSSTHSIRADYLLSTTIRLLNDRLYANFQLIDGKTKSILRTYRNDVAFNADAINAMQIDLAANIAATIGDPRGIIGNLERAKIARDGNHSDAAFLCRMHTAQYSATFKEADFIIARNCLDELRDSEPPDANSLAMLSLLLLEPINARLDARTRSEILADAFGLATKAIRLNPEGFYPRAARFTTAICNNDLLTFAITTREMAEDYSNNPSFLIDYAAKLVLGANDPAKALILLHRAQSITTHLMPRYIIAQAGLMLHGKIPTDVERLKDAALDSGSPNIALMYLAIAAINKDLNHVIEAKSRLKALGYADSQAIDGLMAAQCWSPENQILMNKAIESGLALASPP